MSEQQNEVGEDVDEVYDVLAERTQRAEAAGASPYRFKIGSKQYTWPAELPAATVELAAGLKKVTDDESPEAVALMTKLVRSLSGAHADELLGLLSINDLVVMVPKYMERVAGSRLGESAASPTSSPGTPKPRKQTSKRTTA